jgi:hypothetical protein
VIAGPAGPASHQETSSTPFVSNDGRRLQVSATLEPVFELKTFTRIGFRMNRRVTVVSSGEDLSPVQIAALSSGDALRVDLATIARGIDRLGVQTAAERQLSLIVPFSFASISSRRGRSELVAPLKRAAALVKLGIISEVLDIEGVPPSVLRAATSLVRPFSRRVVGRVRTPASAALGRFAGAGLQALCFESPPGLGDPEFLAWATAAVAATRRVATSVLVFSASSTNRASILASLGASHVSLMSG